MSADRANPYNLPIHEQTGSDCTAHAFAAMTEEKLSDHFKERTLVDVEDLWEKQRKFGTATEEGDSIDGPVKIAMRYGVRFRTDSGKTGRLFVTDEARSGILTVMNWRIESDETESQTAHH